MYSCSQGKWFFFFLVRWWFSKLAGITWFPSPLSAQQWALTQDWQYDCDAVSDEHCFSTGLSSKCIKKWQRKKKKKKKGTSCFPHCKGEKWMEKKIWSTSVLSFEREALLTPGAKKNIWVHSGAGLLTAITVINTQQHGCLAVLSDQPYVCSWVSVFGRGPGSEALRLVNLHFYYHKT